MDKVLNAKLYANEIATFNLWYLDHKFDNELQDFINFMVDEENYNSMIHSDRWSLCYDFLERSFERTDLTTGMAYWIERSK